MTPAIKEITALQERVKIEHNTVVSLRGSLSMQTAYWTDRYNRLGWYTLLITVIALAEGVAITGLIMALARKG